MALNILRVSSIILTAVAMGAELVHLFALPNKPYFTASDSITATLIPTLTS